MYVPLLIARMDKYYVCRCTEGVCNDEWINGEDVCMCENRRVEIDASLTQVMWEHPYKAYWYMYMYCYIYTLSLTQD